ncbi:MAG: hypothetical protein ACE5LU_02940 [Anaerolineae bacterium]
MPQTALKYDVEVTEEGGVELYLPFPLGTRVIVFVIEEPADTFNDLLPAAEGRQ